MSIEILKELTDKLPPFPEAVGWGQGMAEYKMEKGQCKAFNLLWIENLSVTKWYNSAGTKFPIHTHNEKEYIFIISGEMVLKNHRETKHLKEKDVYYLNPEEKHEAEFPVDTFYITVMIPAAKEYPHG